MLLMQFDGATQPKNPGGTMAWAWVLYLAPNTSLASDSGLLGPREAQNRTNNIAEYLAIGKGLRFLHDVRHAALQHAAADTIKLATDLHITGDSQLIINQILGKYKCKSDLLRPYLNRCRELKDALHAQGLKIRLEWVPREQNTVADQMTDDLFQQAGISVVDFAARRQTRKVNDLLAGGDRPLRNYIVFDSRAMSDPDEASVLEAMDCHSDAQAMAEAKQAWGGMQAVLYCEGRLVDIVP